MRFFVFILLGMFWGALQAQNTPVTVSGKVVDAKTGEPLAFVNILLKGKAHYGTMSNEQGVFEMLIPSNTKWPCTLTVSLLGYKTKEVSVTKNTKHLTIRLSTLPVCMDAVAIKEKSDPNKAREILDSAYLRTNENMILKHIPVDSVPINRNVSPLTFYGRNYVSSGKKYFFASEIIVDLSRQNGMSYDTVLAYKLHVDEAFVQTHKKWDYYHANLELVSIDKSKTGNNKQAKHAFIDTVFEKDGHIIYVIVVSKKLNKPAYRALMDSVKIDPTWAAQHEDAFNGVIRHRLKLHRYWIDKTDNYKLLKSEYLARHNSVFPLYVVTRLYEKHNGKVYPYHNQIFTRSDDGSVGFAEILLLNINDTVKISKPETMGNIFLNKLGVMYGNNIKNIVYGPWERYNTLAEDSLAREVMRDILKNKPKPKLAPPTIDLE